MANGRPPGYLIHSEAFEAILVARNLLKKDVSADADMSKQFLADLLAHRGGASKEVAIRLASTLGVAPGALFPELAGWVGPLADRTASRRAAS